MNDAEKKPELQGKLREFLVMRNLYEAAARQLTLKFEILNDEFSVLYARNPIHHIESRVKTPESIAAPDDAARRTIALAARLGTAAMDGREMDA